MDAQLARVCCATVVLLTLGMHVEGLSQEFIAIVVAAIGLAAVMVPQMRALRREIGEVRQLTVALDQRLSTETGAVRREIDGLRQDFDRRLSAEISSLREELNGFREELNGFREELNAIREELNGLRGEVNGLRADVVELRNQVSELRERMARVEGLTWNERFGGAPAT